MVNVEIIVKAKKYQNYMRVLVDNKKVKLKKNGEHAVGVISVAKGSHEIKIKRDFVFGSKFWYISYLFQMIIGIFGSMLPECSKDSNDINFIGSFTTNENCQLIFELNSDNVFKHSQDVIVLKNEIFENNIMKRRQKIMRGTIIGFFVIFFIALIVLLVLL